MQYFLIALMVFLISNPTYAKSTEQSHATSAAKLSQPWKDAQSQEAKIEPDDMLIVYGGQDISLKAAINSILTG